MIEQSENALKVAEFLLRIKAVELRPSKPFTWASGWKSPIYCDNRKVLSYPEVRTYFRQEMVNLINEKYAKPEAVVGVATGGIAMGALVAQELGLPFAYVRPNPKEHGMGNQIEGAIDSGKSIIVIEDLISTGKSSLKAVDVLKQNDYQIKGVIALFSYGFAKASANFEESKTSFATLTTYSALIDQALKMEYITEKDLETLNNWRENPETWGK